MKAKESSLAAMVASVPWCCALPAGLGLLGLAGASTARLVAAELMPLLLGLALLLLGRAHYLIHVRQQGAPWARRMVWLATALAGMLWLPRLWD